MIEAIRAEFYDHVSHEHAIDPADEPNVQLGVDDGVVAHGRVTLAATRGACNDDGCPYGVEFDLSPTDSRVLARELLRHAAAAEADGSSAAD